MKRRFRRLFGILLCLGLVAGLIWKLIPREKLLLDQAQRLIRLPELDAGNYHWLTNHGFLQIESTLDANFKQHYTAFRVDTATGNKQSLPTLNRQLNGAFDGGANLSPDGKRLLWTVYAPAAHNPKTGKDNGPFGEHIYTCLWDGSQSAQALSFVATYATYTHWLADSRHWVELVSMRDPDLGGDGNYHKLHLTRIVVHDITNPRQTQTFPIEPKHPLGRADAAGKPFYDVYHTGSTATCLLCDDLERGYYPERQSTKQIHVLKTDLMAKANTQTFLISPPPNTCIMDMVYSSDGKTIAWDIENAGVPPLPALLHRCFPSIKAFQLTPQRRFELWVSRTDGTEIREIGHVALAEEDESLPETVAPNRIRPHQLHWLPDNNHVSFVCRDYLYVVPTK